MTPHSDQVDPEDRVHLRYVNGYHDGPVSGVAEWKGKRYYFSMIEEAEWSEDEEEPPWYRRYALYDLTTEEWAEEDARHASFVTNVGTHFTYRSDGTRDYGGIKPQTSWSEYYKRYSEPRSWEKAPMGVDRAMIHTFER